jgi:hypothetical protein
MIVKLNQPKVVTWFVALILAVLALLGAILTLGFVTTYAVWFALASAVLLLLATLFAGL